MTSDQVVKMVTAALGWPQLQLIHGQLHRKPGTVAPEGVPEFGLSSPRSGQCLNVFRSLCCCLVPIPDHSLTRYFLLLPLCHRSWVGFSSPVRSYQETWCISQGTVCTSPTLGSRDFPSNKNDYCPRISHMNVL